MADEELSAELAEAEKAFETANANWAADSDNFALKEVKLSADVVVKEIEFKIKEAKVKTLVAQGKGEDDAQVKAAKEAKFRADWAVREAKFSADWAVKEAKFRADLAVKENEFKIKEAKVEAIVTQEGKGDDDAQVKFFKEAMQRADWAVKEAKFRADLAAKENEFKIKEAKVEALLAQGKEYDDAQVKAAKAALDDARKERNKAETRLDEFITSRGIQQGLSADELRQIAVNLCGPSLEALPELHDLRGRLERVVPAALPVWSYDLRDALALYGEQPNNEPTSFEFLQVADRFLTSKNFPPLGYLLENESNSVLNGTKKMMHKFMAHHLQDPLKYLMDWLVPLQSRQFARNATQSNKRVKTTVDDCRPDSQLHLRILVFRGEEKQHGLPLEESRKELLSKFEKWSPVLFGDVDYVLAYASAGVELQLFAIHRASDMDPSPRLYELGDRLYLNRAQDSFKLIKYLINLTRVIEAIINHLPKGINLDLGPYNRVESGNYSKIEFYQDYVRKELKDVGTVQHDVRLLKRIYKRRRDKKIVNTIVCMDGYPKEVTMDNGQQTTVLHLQPVGCQRLPRNAAELRRALLCVLEALASMHENKIVHRDVRWPNIIINAFGQILAAY